MSRLIYLDLLKTIAIFMVCFYHVNTLDNNVLTRMDVEIFFNYFLNSSLSMCVPLFFMVNGALLLNKPFPKLSKHVIKTTKLLCLTYLWAILIQLTLIAIFGTDYTIKSFIRSIWELEPGKLNHLWFLLAIVSIYLLFPLIKLAFDQTNKQIFFYFCAIFFIFSFANLVINSVVNILQGFTGLIYITNDKYQYFRRFNPFGQYAYACFYFSLGGYLALLIKEKKIPISNKMIIAIFVIAVISLFTYGCFMTFFYEKYYDTVWDGYYSLMTLVMSVTTFILAERARLSNDKLNKVLAVTGENTLGIYLIHGIFGKILKPYFHNSWLSQSLIANILFALVIIILSLLVSLLIKRTPILSNLLKV